MSQLTKVQKRELESILGQVAMAQSRLTAPDDAEIIKARENLNVAARAMNLFIQHN